MKDIIKSLYLWLDTELPAGQELGPAKIDWVRCLPFIFTHLMCLGVFWVGVSPVALLACFLGYASRVFALTAFYHRYLSHRAFKTSRLVQFIFVFIGSAAAQRGPLWWSAHHRFHHKHADQEEDQHSPARKGFFFSHCGWFLMSHNFATKKDLIKDFSKFPELVFINRFDFIAPMLYASLLFIFGGWQLLVWGYFVSTVLVYHVTFSINSLAHEIGKRDFDTKDKSHNNWWLAILTFGEGWHNNHHHYPSSARQGFKKYQLDITYLILLGLEKLHLVWDLRQPPKELAVSS